MTHRRKLDNFIEDVRARQRNIVFPDTVRNERYATVFFWNGSANPTRVQRVAAWMFGLLFIASGLGFLPAAARARDEDHSWIFFGIMMLISVAFVMAGARTFRNGFPRQIKPAPKSN
jgi:hypothetical protein